MQSSQITLGGENVVVASEDYLLARGKANGFRCPVGRAVGRGAVLMTRQSLERLGTGGGPYSLKFQTREDAAEVVDLKRVWIHSAIRTNGGGNPEDPNAVYLVRLVDVRFFLQEWSDTTNHSFNVRSFAGGDPYKDYLPDTCKPSQKPYSFSEIAAILWGECKQLGAFPGLPITPAANFPENVRLIGSAWIALNDLVERIGCYIVYDPTADSFSIVAAKSIGAFPGKGRDLYNSVALSPQACLLPEKVRVYFSKFFEDYGTERDTESPENWSTTEAIYFVDVPTNSAGAVSGTTKAIWVETPALRQQGTDRIKDEPALKAMAVERVQAWINIYQADKMSRLDFIEQGVLAIMPSAEIKVVWWRAFAREGLVTQVTAHPGMPTDGEIGSGSGKTEGSIDVLKESTSAPDLARATYPNFPRLPNIVKLTLGTAAAGAPGFVKAFERNYIFGGNVMRYNPAKGDLEDLENCWIYLTGQRKNASQSQQKTPGPMSELNQIYYARLSGVYVAQSGNYKGVRLPLYVATADDATSVSNACTCAAGGQAAPVDTVERVSRLTFDKGVGLRLFQNPTEPSEACVGLYGCAPNTVLNQQAAFPQRPVWTGSPRLAGNLTIGGALKFGDQGGSVMGNGAQIRLPGIASMCGLPVEVKGVNGPCVQLGYGLQGYTGIFQTYDCYGALCQTFIVSNGRIVYSNAPLMIPHTCSGSAPCPPQDTPPCLPCNEQSPGSGSGSGGQVEDPFRTIQFSTGASSQYVSGSPAIGGGAIGTDGSVGILATLPTTTGSGSTSTTSTGATSGNLNTVANVLTPGASSGKWPTCSSLRGDNNRVLLTGAVIHEGYKETLTLYGSNPSKAERDLWKQANALVQNDFSGYRPLTAAVAGELLTKFAGLPYQTYEEFKTFVYRCNSVDLSATAASSSSGVVPPYSTACKCSGFLFYPSSGTPSKNFSVAAAIVKNDFKNWRPFNYQNWEAVNDKLADFDPSNTSETSPPTHPLTEDEFTIFRLEAYCWAKKQFDAESANFSY